MTIDHRNSILNAKTEVKKSAWVKPWKCIFALIHLPQTAVSLSAVILLKVGEKFIFLKFEEKGDLKHWSTIEEVLVQLNSFKRNVPEV